MRRAAASSHFPSCIRARTATFEPGAVGGWSEFRISRSIIAFSEEGNAICRLEDSYAYAEHSIAYGNEGGDWLYGGDLNIYGDPLFCGAYAGDFALCENSQARPDNNPWGVLMGASSASCGPCDSQVRRVSWGSIKAGYR